MAKELGETRYAHNEGRTFVAQTVNESGDALVLTAGSDGEVRVFKGKDCLTSWRRGQI